MFKNVSLNQIYVLSTLLDQDRYGLDIVKTVAEQSNILVAIGSLYNILSKLEREGFVESYWGEETAERGGHRKKYYKITGAGQSYLKDVQSGLSNMWGWKGFSLGFTF